MSDASELADRLDEIADPNFPGVMGYTAANDLRAAATELRRLLAERDALADPDPDNRSEP